MIEADNLFLKFLCEKIALLKRAQLPSKLTYKLKEEEKKRSIRCSAFVTVLKRVLQFIFFVFFALAVFPNGT